MKKIIVALSLLISALCHAGTVDVLYQFTDFNVQTQAVKRVTQTPLQAMADYNGAILTPTPVVHTTDTNGYAYFSNTVAGYSYRIQIDTPFGSTVRTCGFPSTLTGTVNGQGYLGDIFKQSFYYLYPWTTNYTIGGAATNVTWAVAGTNVQTSTNGLGVTVSLTNRPAFNGQDVTNIAGANVDFVPGSNTSFQTNGHQVTISSTGGGGSFSGDANQFAGSPVTSVKSGSLQTNNIFWGKPITPQGATNGAITTWTNGSGTTTITAEAPTGVLTAQQLNSSGLISGVNISLSGSAAIAGTYTGNGLSITNLRGTNIDIRFGTAGTTNADGSITVSAAANPNALTNTDTRTPAISSPMLITPGGGGFGTLSLQTNSGIGFYQFGNGMVFMGGNLSAGIAYQFNAKDNAATFGVADTSGNLIWGGTNYNNAFFNAPYLVGSVGMMTNFAGVDSFNVAAACPVPEFWIDYYFDAQQSPLYGNLNAKYATNVIALMQLWGWDKQGWTNIAFDPGPYTNRSGGHLVAHATQFPNVTNMVSYIHSQGWKAGAYLYHSSPGCFPGLIATTDDQIFSDMADLTAAGFDFVKIDTCSGTTYQGLDYASGTLPIMMREALMFSWANNMMAPLYNRRPMEIDYTKYGNGNVRLIPTLQNLFNSWEDASPNGSPSVFGGALTNFINEQASFPGNIRPGHFPRFQTADYTLGSTALNKEFVTACAMMPAAIYSGTNFGSANMVYYTNSAVVNVIKNRRVHPGYQLSTNAATGVSVFGRPLSDLSELITSSGQFNGGHVTFGGMYSNAVWFENLSGSSQTAIVNWGQLGIPSNTLWSVTELWTGTVKGTFYNTFSDTVLSRDCGLYLFSSIPGTNATVVNLGLDSSGNWVTNASPVGGTGGAGTFNANQFDNNASVTNIKSGAIVTNLVSQGTTRIAAAIMTNAGTTTMVANLGLDSSGSFVTNSGGTATDTKAWHQYGDNPLATAILGTTNNVPLNVFAYSNQMAFLGTNYTIWLGNSNSIQVELAQNASIWGGHSNTINGASTDSSIVAGFLNRIGESNVVANEAIILGGDHNTNYSISGVAFGYGNYLGQMNAGFVGGHGNLVGDISGGVGSFIGSGTGNYIGTNAIASVIVGGQFNNISNGIGYSFIGGGYQNSVGPASADAMIPGGFQNLVNGFYAMAAGNRAKATHNGSYVWGDSIVADQSDNGTDSYTVRATGGQFLTAGGAYTYNSVTNTKIANGGTVFTFASSNKIAGIYVGTNAPGNGRGTDISNSAIGGTNMFVVEAPGQVDSLVVTTNGSIKIGNPGTTTTVVNLGMDAKGFVTTNAVPVGGTGPTSGTNILVSGTSVNLVANVTNLISLAASNIYGASLTVTGAGPSVIYGSQGQTNYLMVGTGGVIESNVLGTLLNKGNVYPSNSITLPTASGMTNLNWTFGFVAVNDTGGRITNTFNGSGLTNLGEVTSIALPMGAWFTNNIPDGASVTAASPINATNSGDGMVFTDAVTNEARIRFAAPWDWDGGTVQIGAHAYCTGTNSLVATNIVFSWKIAAIGDSDREDSLTFGTAITVTNNVGTNKFVLGTAGITRAITVGNTPTSAKNLVISVQRLGAASGDTCTNSSLVLSSARLYYKRLTRSDFPTASP